MAKKKNRELATTNIRIYKSTHPILQEKSRLEGKSIPRVIDEKFNPEKYQTLTDK